MFDETTGMQNPIFNIMGNQMKAEPTKNRENPMNMNYMNSNSIQDNPAQRNPMMTDQQSFGQQGMCNMMNPLHNQPMNYQGMEGMHRIGNMDQQQMQFLQMQNFMQSQMKIGGFIPPFENNNMGNFGMNVPMNQDMIINNLMELKKDFSENEIDSNLKNKFESDYNIIKSKKYQIKKNSDNINININYYGIIIKINISPKFYICKLIDYIYDEIFGEIKEIIFPKRTNKNQTTQYIIQNPNIKLVKKRINEFFELSEYLFLEYKNQDLKDLKDRACNEIGLKNEDEIFLKFNKEKFIKNEKDEHPISNKLLNKTYGEYKINIIFENSRGGENKKKSIAVPAHETISNLIKEYYSRIGEIDSKEKQFIFNSNYLDKMSNDTVRDLIKHSLGDHITITFNDTTKLNGAGSFPFVDFADISSKKIKMLTVDHSGKKKWREINQGLNIFGICENENCSVKGKEVIFKTQLTWEGLHFRLNEELGNLKCPICEGFFKPKTCGFWRCEYQFVGRNINYKKGKKECYISEPHETIDDAFEYFDPIENGIKTWEVLSIFVIGRQKIKYEKE